MSIPVLNIVPQAVPATVSVPNSPIQQQPMIVSPPVVSPSESVSFPNTVEYFEVYSPPSSPPASPPPSPVSSFINREPISEVDDIILNGNENLNLLQEVPVSSTVNNNVVIINENPEVFDEIMQDGLLSFPGRHQTQDLTFFEQIEELGIPRVPRKKKKKKCRELENLVCTIRGWRGDPG